MAFVPKVLSRQRDHELGRLSLLHEVSRSFSELIEPGQLISRVISETGCDTKRTATRTDGSRSIRSSRI